MRQILYADNEDNLRRIVTDFADTYALDRYFVYGFGSHHLWLKQRKKLTHEKSLIIVY